MTRRVLLLVLLSACVVPRMPAQSEDQTCTRCHGDAARPGDALSRSAPPNDLRGNSDVAYPGVGLHERHLNTLLTRSVSCASCHDVPQQPMASGHNDGTTQVVLADGVWDATSRTCTTACHAGKTGVWTKPLGDAGACLGCHAMPPAAPHPQSTSCSGCHAEVVDVAGAIIDPTKHIDGQVQSDSRCDACHGSASSAAPPRALDGGSARTARGVGAHETHLFGGTHSRPQACEACHEVPATVATPSHPDGQVQVANFDVDSERCMTACHFGSSPPWTSTVALGCDGCHGAPPAPPHPAVAQCATCHPEVSASTHGRHADGQLDVALPTACDGCHGDAQSPAPPRRLDGSSTPDPHRAHVIGSGRAQPVRCQTCHPVPAAVQTATHPDGAIEVVFSGVSVANGAAPTFDGQSCGSTACHSVAHFTGSDGGGTDSAPAWQLGDADLTCTSCHGAPPPAPHPAQTACASCHVNVTVDLQFIDPELHVNGVVNFFF